MTSYGHIFGVINIDLIVSYTDEHGEIVSLCSIFFVAKKEEEYQYILDGNVMRIEIIGSVKEQKLAQLFDNHMTNNYYLIPT